jgi:N utilization substance protein B
MALDPHKKRELVFLLLFSADMGQELLSRDLLCFVADECKVSKHHVAEAVELAQEIQKAQIECDALITKKCQEYSMARLQSVERTILRLAIFELVLKRELAPKIVFAEAKRLAKKFSTDEAVAFVHGILGAVAKDAGCEP